jgi:ethanolamine permease
MILLFSTNFLSHSSSLINFNHIANGLPYGYIGIIGALQFGLWFYLGLEGGSLAADECRSVNRALPVGTIVGFLTLLIGGTITWFICSGLLDASTLAKSTYPLFDAAKVTKIPFVIIALFIGTMLSCLASANGCINDASRAWFAMSKDTLLPGQFSAVHPKYKTPYRAIIFILPIALAFGFAGVLDQIVTFSILSAILVYLFSAYMIFKFRKMYPLNSIKRGYISPAHPIPALIVIGLCLAALIGIYFGYWKNLLGGLIFYFLASLWFTLHRYKFVDKNHFIKKYWPRPKGY